MAAFIKKQKAQTSELKKNLNKSKEQFKQDKANVESIRLSDPALYRMKM
jgi:hypothetical protein